eukprot:gnl/TRDRNA2_/TRDRNA2_123256_c0_seq1.p1 gnl/TRDRNA2_/TRDRNA2_123256_c0~~gnl/TRDRNA2_/TRDRNA2_123256_c0_seq1.p1  ORF type:complete len:253 (-),score=20.60 gnl/TRDRNA2_/TRDRNA2_123256_c0_seq1:68-826(-)
MFLQVVNAFRLPEEGMRVLRYAHCWANLKRYLEEEDSCNIWEQPLLVPMLAMNGGTPCAAALCLDARDQVQLNASSFYLVKMIRNAGADCQGAGAAILCNLIRNSRDRTGNFSPLKLDVVPNMPELQSYYETFGCVYGEFEHANMACPDPNPRKCQGHLNHAFDADQYFKDVTSISAKLPKLPPGSGFHAYNEADPVDLALMRHTDETTDDVRVFFASLVCLFVAAGLALLHFRHRRLIPRQDELWDQMLAA